MTEAQEQELRWHLPVMVPRLRLNDKERTLAVSSLNIYLQDRSSIAVANGGKKGINSEGKLRR